MGEEELKQTLIKEIKELSEENAKLKAFVTQIKQKLQNVAKGEETTKRNTTTSKQGEEEKREPHKVPDESKGKEHNILITAALPYVNNVPHLGNIIGAVLSADVYARYLRQIGKNVIYMGGTDEYGTATETKALKEGLTCRQICDKYHKIHADIYKWFNISFDHFGRTSTEHQTEIAQGIYKDIREKGYLSEKETVQLYSEKDKMFLADRYVLGTCPKCGDENARGDQCDACGGLLNADELINPRSAISGDTPVKKSSTHIFLNLDEIQPKLEEWVEPSIRDGKWTNVASSITRAWLKEGLLPRCITRDLKWGTPVPDKENKVFYVWFDAPIGYISITKAYAGNDWEKWWKNPEKVQLVQFMGKDNVPFHSVIFPSSLIGTGKKWTLVNSLSSTAYLNYEETKFSKSNNVGVFGNHCQDTGYPSFVWRYYLISTRPTGSDSQFTWDDFASKTNNELLANIGNFTNRGLRFIAAYFNSTLPTPQEGYETKELEKELLVNINTQLKAYHTAFETIRMKEALQIVCAISKLGNQYFQTTQPWKIVKENDPYTATICYVAVQLVYLVAILAKPFMPGLTDEIMTQMAVENPTEDRPIPFEFHYHAIPAGHPLGKASGIVPKISADDAKKWKKHFSGVDEDDEKEAFPFDLRVVRVVDVKEHPEADHLYVLKVSLGGDETRQVCAGLRNAFTPDQLLNKYGVLMCNLEPFEFNGQLSEGMLIAAKKSAKELEMITFEGDVEGILGKRLNVEDNSMTLQKVDNLNRKSLQKLLKKFKTGPKGEAQFKRITLKVDNHTAFAPNTKKNIKIA